MPIYSYKCRSYSKGQDRHHGFDESVVDLCDCGGELNKVFHLFGIKFKGEGFYRSDTQENKPKED